MGHKTAYVEISADAPGNADFDTVCNGRRTGCPWIEKAMDAFERAAPVGRGVTHADFQAVVAATVHLCRVIRERAI